MDVKMIVIGLLIGLLVGLGVGYAIKPQIQSNQNNELSGTIIVKGSNTLLIVAQRWAENFSSLHPQVNIPVSGEGSGVGFQALAAKTTDIADASREIKASEVNACKANGVNPVEWVVGLDGISIVAHPSNPVTNLTMTQLEMIFNGTYTNWNQVGGNNAPIITYGRESTSGTYEYFKETVLHKQDFRADIITSTGSKPIVEAVETQPNGIGYVGVAYTKQGANIKTIALKITDTATLYQPTITNIKSGDYPLARKLYIYTDDKITELLDAYISFMLGSKGQQILEDNDYISYVKLEK